MVTRSCPQRAVFYICTLSPQVIVYKGMLTPGQLLPFFPGPARPRFRNAPGDGPFAVFHQHVSSWDRAQPNRFMSHNGEINTLRGNMNWMHAREGLLRSDLFGDDLSSCSPVVEAGLLRLGHVRQRARIPADGWAARCKKRS